VTTRRHKVHTQIGRAAVQIFAANDHVNQILIEHAWLKWPRDRIVNQLRLAWASRFAVHSSYHGCGVGTRLAFHLKTVARRFRAPSANFLEVITTVPKSSKDEDEKGDFLVRAGYLRMKEPLKSAPLRRLNHETGYMDSVSARKYYYYVDLRQD
jgi:GNAT superfamily N-acetyltransferase